MFCEFESRSWRGVLDTPVCDKDGQWLSADQWFSPGSPPIKKKWLPRYNWTIVESAVQHHTLKPLPN